LAVATAWEETVKKIIKMISLAVALSIVAQPAFAYLDPGTGSMLLQVILGGIAAVGVALKLFWHKIRVAIGLSKKAPEEDETA
jgi:CBS-domain-containing membrane protein